jgi:hypothetical protein
VSAGRERVVSRLLELGVELDAATSGGQTALHYAASKGNTTILRALLAAGAKVNARDKTGSTPLHRAASAGKYDAAVVLVEEGRAKLDSHDKAHATALLVAVGCREANIAVYLASKGANLEVRCALCVACAGACVRRQRPLRACASLPRALQHDMTPCATRWRRACLPGRDAAAARPLLGDCVHQRQLLPTAATRPPDRHSGRQQGGRDAPGHCWRHGSSPARGSQQRGGHDQRTQRHGALSSARGGRG